MTVLTSISAGVDKFVGVRVEGLGGGGFHGISTQGVNKAEPGRVGSKSGLPGLPRLLSLCAPAHLGRVSKS